MILPGAGVGQHQIGMNVMSRQGSDIIYHLPIRNGIPQGADWGILGPNEVF